MGKIAKKVKKTKLPKSPKRVSTNEKEDNLKFDKKLIKQVRKLDKKDKKQTAKKIKKREKMINRCLGIFAIMVALMSAVIDLLNRSKNKNQ